MRHCPHDECGHRLRTGQAAEYLDRVRECAECGTELVDGPTEGTPFTASPLGSTSRLLVTAAAVIAVLIAQAWTLEVSELHLRPFRLGLAPLLAALIGVEIAAALLPRFRGLRRFGRERLDRAALWLTLPVALTFASAAVVSLIDDWVLRVLAVITWVAAVYALGMVAGLVTRFGLGNGFAVLVGAAALPALPILVRAGTSAIHSGQTILAAVVIASVIAATLLVLRAHERSGPRLPTCGVIPLDVAAIVFAVPVTLQTPALAGQSLGLSPSLLLAGALAGGAALALGRLFARGMVADTDARALATVRSVLFVAAAFAAGALLSTVRLPIPGVYAIVLATAVALDLWHEWNDRSLAVRWANAAVLTSVYEIDAAKRALDDAGITVVLIRGAALRTLLHIFGAFAPLEVWVPPAQLERAREALAR